MSTWKAMMKLAFALFLIIGQETVWCIIYTSLHQPVLNYTDVGVIFEENGPPILTFVNSNLPDGTTPTTSFTDFFLEYANEEEASVQLQSIDYVAETGESVEETLKNFAELVHEDAECFEEEECAEEHYESEEKEAWAAYYIYQMDEVNDKYSIGVYGNQAAAASCPSFGAAMLQTLAKKISGVDELQLDIRNHSLKVSKPLFP